jgi:hypothetical protein
MGALLDERADDRGVGERHRAEVEDDVVAAVLLEHGGDARRRAPVELAGGDDPHLALPPIDVQRERGVVLAHGCCASYQTRAQGLRACADCDSFPRRRGRGGLDESGDPG